MLSSFFNSFLLSATFLLTSDSIEKVKYHVFTYYHPKELKKNSEENALN